METAAHFAATSPPRPKVRQRITLRIARADDAVLIGNLVRHAGWMVDGIDWSDIGANWLVAEHDGLIAGCIMVLPGKPIGFLEFLATVDGMPHRRRATVVRALLLQGLATLTRFGSQRAAGHIGQHRKDYIRVLERRGAMKFVADTGGYVIRLGGRDG